MNKLHAIEAFIRIVDAGSITAAAEQMAVSQPSMVRTLAALERDLGVRLLNRTTRRMSLTDEGRDYCEQGRQILAAAAQAQQSMSARRLTPRGRLRITSSVSFGRRFLAPAVNEFLGEYPDVDIELLLLDRVVDLIDEGIDLAVRVARLSDSTMVAHKIGEVRSVVVASPAVIRRYGAPETPAELKSKRCVSFTGVVSPDTWSFGAGRRQTQIAIKSVLITNQVDTGVLACVQGAGFGRFLSHHVIDEIRSGSLVRILRNFEGDAIPANFVYPGSRLQSVNVRAFVSFAKTRLRDQLSLAS